MVDLKGMLNTFNKPMDKSKEYRLSTTFEYTGLKEYPRPQLKRESYINLNGKWDLSFLDKQGENLWSGQIEVPFSPETQLSGVERKLLEGESLVYERMFNVEKLEESRLILHFGAVDQIARVYVNDRMLLEHSGGYTSFSIDVTDAIFDGDNQLKVVVVDEIEKTFLARGKQKRQSDGMFYTAQSGIWQTVWMEWVPEAYIKRLDIKPDLDLKKVYITVEVSKAGQNMSFELKDGNLREFAIKSHGGVVELEINLDNIEAWSPENPKLYDFVLTYGEDRVESYFAMRKVECKLAEDGYWRIFLNNEKIFLMGILDQGYYPESLMTPPSDDAMVNDIKAVKKLGYNMIRKHCKIEPMRWYYHCDRLGMIVWQDIINGGGIYDMTFLTIAPTVSRLWKYRDDTRSDLMKHSGRGSVESREVWFVEAEEEILQLRAVPSLIGWTVFNEGWGQFDAKRCTAFLKERDNSRLVDATSGWFHEGCGDVFSEHVYFFDLKAKKKNKPYIISEYGGYTYKCEGHSFRDAVYGYRSYDSLDKLNEDYQALINQLKSLEEKGLCGGVFTQLTDVEEELNGILSYDRRVQKIR